MKRLFAAPIFAGPVLMGLLALAAPAYATPTSPVAAVEQPQDVQTTDIDGFRSAKFGMDEKALLGAIATDFGIKANQVQHEIHPLEKTAILSVKVDNLLPDTGPALVSYVLGYRSHKLIQVSVLWHQVNGRAVAAAAMTLRDYFRSLPLVPEKTVIDGKMQDGSVLAFRGVDAKGRMVLEVFSAGQTGQAEQPAVAEKGAKKAKAEKAPAEKDKKAEERPDVLRLLYIESPENPDTFHLKPGEF